jgi:hypothetical protein
LKLRTRVRLAGILLFALAAIGVPAAPAFAAAEVVTTAGELGVAVSSTACIAPKELVLANDITAISTTITVANGCVATIDLAGFDLSLRSISLNSGAQLTVDNSSSTGILTVDASSTANLPGIRVESGASLTLKADGTVATGGSNGAGIGGGGGNSAGTIVIDGDDTTAIGGPGSTLFTGGAGIGGSGTGSTGGGAGLITINGDRTSATGGGYAAGIGGGTRGTSGVIIINGDDTQANAGNNAAGIGGGNQGRVDNIEIHGDGTIAYGSDGGAGIGSGYLSRNTIVQIFGANTEAHGGADGGAGIGSGSIGSQDNSGSTILLYGTGTTAYAGATLGAAIGGGANADGGLIDFSAGSTTTAYGATAFAMAAAIGGGYGGATSIGEGDGGTVIIDEGATVTAYGGSTLVGHGHIAPSPSDPSAAGDFGILVVNGTLRIPGTTDTLRIPDSMPGSTNPEVIIGSTGLIAGAAATPGTGASIRAVAAGSRGTIANQGIIAFLPSQVTSGTPAIAGVLVNHYRLTFDSGASVTVDPPSFTIFAPTVASGERTLPPDPTPPAGQVFQGWYLQGTSQKVTDSTFIPGLVPGSTDADRVLVALEAHYGAPPPSTGGSGGSGGSGSSGGSGGGGELIPATPTPTPTPTPSSTPEPTAQPTAQPTTPATTPEPTAAPEPDDAPGDAPVWPWVVGGIAAVLLLALLAFLLLRRRRRQRRPVLSIE